MFDCFVECQTTGPDILMIKDPVVDFRSSGSLAWSASENTRVLSFEFLRYVMPKEGLSLRYRRTRIPMLKCSGVHLSKYQHRYAVIKAMSVLQPVAKYIMLPMRALNFC